MLAARDWIKCLVEPCGDFLSYKCISLHTLTTSTNYFRYTSGV